MAAWIFIHKKYKDENRVNVIKHFQQGHVYALDGISGLSAMIIMIYHYGLFARYLDGHPYPLDEILGPIYQYGYLAVELFFLMSGFVIEYSYSKKVKTYTLYQFMMKRVQRLYPLLFFTTLLTGILQLIFYQMTNHERFFAYPITLWGVFLHIWGLQNAGLSELTFNGPAWYVGVLVLMYVLYYLSSLSVHRLKIYVMFIILGIYIYCGNYNLPFFNEAIARGGISFFTGVLLSIYYRLRKPRKLYVLSLGGGGLIVSSFLIYIYGGTIIGNIVLFFALAYFPVLLICILNSNLLSAVLSSRPFVFLGGLSYDIFLYHFPLQIVFVLIYKSHIFKGFHLYTVQSLGLWMITTILVAYLSKKFIDKKVSNIFDYCLQVFDLPKGKEDV